MLHAHAGDVVFKIASQHATDCGAEEILATRIFGAFCTQIGIDTALHDAVECLGMRIATVEFFQAARPPALRKAHRFCGVFARHFEWRALVQLHDQIGAELPLDLDRFFRRQE